MTARRQPRIYDRWAQLRFSVIGQLLADPPVKGTLQSEINKLSLREWRHPATGEPVRFGCSTIQRWYYKALRERTDPVGVLRRKPRQDAGHQASMTTALRQVLRAQHDAHPNWSAQLHHEYVPRHIFVNMCRQRLCAGPPKNPGAVTRSGHILIRARRAIRAVLARFAILACVDVLCGSSTAS